MRTERIIELDIAKGICILLMVIGHSGMTNIVHHMIYAFHMPFFFFISGVTTNVNRSFRVFSISKVNGLLVPFLIYYLIHVPSYAYIYNRNIMEYFKWESFNGIDNALWFIPILFFAQLINWMIPRHSFIEMVSIVLLAAFSSFLCIEGIHLPWNLSILGLAASFVLLGRILSVEGCQTFIFSESIYSKIWIMITTFFLLFLISNHYHLAMSFDVIEPTLLIMVGALAGIICVLMVSSIIKRSFRMLSQFLAYTGANTFLFVGFSQAILKFENYYIRDMVVLKYVLLLISLYILIWIKNQFPLAKALRL